ncbi:hypothetical protein F4212_07120 [Candidatus Poribacteria bacterium]|nr:hypothetical protein [Candidatus Poribacteria bacterium]
MEREDRVSVLTIRRIWVDLALTIFSFQVIVYAVLLIRHEVVKGNAPMETAQVIVAQLASVMAVATGITFILFQGVDFVMFLTQLYKERLKRKIKEAKAEGKAEERSLWEEWNNRRLEAEAKGDEFNEPPPNETQNTSE